MKRTSTIALLTLTAMVLWLGCSSPQQQAQNMFNAGQFEELVAKFEANPELAGIVQQAKDKIAEKWVAEGKYQEVLTTYPNSPAAKDAKNKLAEQAFMAGNYQEVVMKYMDTPWGMQARMKMDSIANAATGGAQPGKPGQPGQPPSSGGVDAQKETAAQTALDNVMKIQMKRQLKSALEQYVSNPAYAGTKALAKAKAELAKL